MKDSRLHVDHRARMRERFRKNGICAFEEHEILEMLLYPALPRRNTNGIAHELIGRFGSISGVLSADERQLCELNGIGSGAAGHLLLLGELFSDVSGELFENIPILTEDVSGIYAMLRMGLAPSESAMAVYLDDGGLRLFEEWLYHGKKTMTDGLVVHMIERIKETSASSLLLMYNHKHEPLVPSPEDIAITLMLRKEAREIGEINVYHVIVSDDGYLHI